MLQFGDFPLRCRGALLSPDSALLRLRRPNLGSVHLSLQLNGLLESSHQKAVALREIVGQRVGVIHGTNCCNNSRESRKSNCRKTSSAHTAIALSPASALEVHPIEQLGQLGVLQLKAGQVAQRTGQGKSTHFQAFVDDAKPVTIPKQDLEPIPAMIHEQKQVTREWVLVEDLLSHAH
jgi:hypothetical protein